MLVISLTVPESVPIPLVLDTATEFTVLVLDTATEFTVLVLDTANEFTKPLSTVITRNFTSKKLLQIKAIKHEFMLQESRLEARHKTCQWPAIHAHTTLSEIPEHIHTNPQTHIHTVTNTMTHTFKHTFTPKTHKNIHMQTPKQAQVYTIIHFTYMHTNIQTHSTLQQTNQWRTPSSQVVIKASLHSKDDR